MQVKGTHGGLPVTFSPSERSHQTWRDEPLHGPLLHLYSKHCPPAWTWSVCPYIFFLKAVSYQFIQSIRAIFLVIWLLSHLCRAGPPALVLDIAAGFQDPGPLQLWIEPGQSQNPDRLHSRSSAGTDSTQSSQSGSNRLQDVHKDTERSDTKPTRNHFAFSASLLWSNTLK